MSSSYCLWWDRASDYGAGSHNAPPADMCAFQQYDVLAYPAMRLDNDVSWRVNALAICVVDVVAITGQHRYPLGKKAVFPDGDDCPKLLA